jgi:Tol biopolymer transport system component
MATGKHAFAGKTQSAVVGSILALEPPPVSSIQPSVPPALDRIVRICLEKDPNDRYQCAHDLMLSLQAIAETPVEAPPSLVSPAKGVSRWVWVTTAAALLVAIASALYFASVALAPTPVVRAYILPPDKAQFSTMLGSGGGGAPTISPDGTKLAFIARIPQGKAMLYVQALSSATAQPLAGTEDAFHPFWSPDSRWIGFFAGNQVKKIEASGGPAQTLCEAPSTNERGGSWSADGTILFGFGSNVSPLLQVSSAGGASSPALQFAPGESTHRWPQWLPDGKHFLFFVDSTKPDSSGIYVGSLASREHKLILRTADHAQYVAPGYLLFLREQTLMAQPFNLRRLELTGEAVPIAEHVAANQNIRRALFSASANGDLVFQTGAGSSGSNLIWYDREGKQAGAVGGSEPYLNPDISPDGTRVAVTVNMGIGSDADIWIFDLRRGTKTRLTFGPGRSHDPLWTPDGKYIVYSVLRNGRNSIFRKAADNSGPEEAILSDNANDVATSISRDGRYLSVDRVDPASKTSYDIFVLPLFGERKPFPIVQTQFTEVQGAISPDGRWLAYVSNQSGAYEIFVTAFPGGGTKSQVSVSGGFAPKWRNDGRELYYETADNRLFAVDVSSSGAIQLGTPKQLLETSMVGPTSGPYAVLDGKKFLINAVGGTTEAGDPFTLVTNWPGLLKK